MEISKSVLNDVAGILENILNILAWHDLGDKNYRQETQKMLYDLEQILDSEH